jgi:glycerol-3-phosphate O-acyltransferase/dihydroxyacetone phosphate acyltransferase
MRNLIRRVFSLALRVFFARIDVAGLEHMPREGPVIVVVNHPNGLIDPLCILCTMPRPVSFLAKEPIFRMPVLGWLARKLDAIPVYRRQDEGADMARNRETFGRARAVLARGGTIALFPEGASHSDPKLRPLKTGAARIALGAAAGTGGLAVVPAGLYYTAKAIFRSAALVYFGAPLPVEPVVLGPDGEPPAEAARELTARIERALAALTLQADEAEALSLIARAERIFSADDTAAGRKDLAAELELRRRFVAGHARARVEHPERLETLVARMTAYEAELAAVGLDPERLAPEYFTPGTVVRYTTKRLLLATLLLPAALVGALIHYPAYRLIRTLAQRLSKGDDDVLSTIKVLASMLLFPLTWLLVAGAVDARAGTAAGLAALGVLPLLGYAALRFVEGLDNFRGAVRAFRLFVLRRDAFVRLVAERRAIREAIVELGQQVGA